jgi:hypothetical protein
VRHILRKPMYLPRLSRNCQGGNFIPWLDGNRQTNHSDKRRQMIYMNMAINFLKLAGGTAFEVELGGWRHSFPERH